MSEVSGAVVLKLPVQLLNEFDCEQSIVSWTLVNDIFKAAELSFESDAFMIGHSYKKKEGFYTEGIKVVDDYVLLEPFDPEWMYITQTLVEKGNNIEIYGSIFGDYGGALYALSGTGERYFSSRDEEDEDETISFKEMWQAFLKVVPGNVKKIFPDAFQ